MEYHQNRLRVCRRFFLLPECADRGQALKAIVTLVFDHQLTREFAIDYMKQLLNGRLSDAPYYLNAEIVSCSSDLYPLEVYEDIKQLYESGELEKNYIDFSITARTFSPFSHSPGALFFG